MDEKIDTTLFFTLIYLSQLGERCNAVFLRSDILSEPPSGYENFHVH